MAKLTFFSVLKSNLKCAVCKNKDCPVRYYPERKKSQFSGGSKFVTRCEKDKKAHEDRIMRELLKRGKKR